MPACRRRCMAAADECGAPVVSSPAASRCCIGKSTHRRSGLHRARTSSSSCAPTPCCWRRSSTCSSRAPISLCTVHLDGDREDHDKAVSQAGTYDKRRQAIRAARAKGIPRQHQLHAVRRGRPRATADFFDEVKAMGVGGVTISPGYAYERAPDTQHFLNRREYQAAVPRDLPPGQRRGWTSFSPRCSWIFWPATRPIIARRGATRRATCSAGSGPATCSAKAMRRPSRN